jgi:hypothetical protein
MTVAISAAVAGAASGAPSEIEPHRQNYTGVSTLTYFDPQPAGLIDLTEPFTSNTGQFTGLGTGTLTISGGVGAIAVTTGNTLYEQLTASSISLPNFFIEATVTSISGQASGTRESRVAFIKDLNNYMEATYQHAANTLVLDMRVAGTFFSLSTKSIALTPPFRIGISLVGNSLCSWYSTNATSAWNFGSGADISSHLDMTVAANFSGFNAAICGFNNAGGASWTVNFDDLKIGRFGGVGMRDMRVVHDEIGNTYVDGSGNVIIHATMSDPRAGANTGVFTFNPLTSTLTQVGVIHIARSGHIYPDTAGDIIRYSATSYKMVASTWGSGAPVHIIYGAVAGVNILSGSQVVTLSTSFTLPTASGQPTYTSWYDPCLMNDGTQWYLAYTNGIAASTFVPCLATSPDLVTWTLVGNDTIGSKYEGTNIVYFNKKHWVAAGGPSGGSTDFMRIYDLTMTLVGTLSATITPGPANSNPPWPCIFSYDSKHDYLFTFNGTLAGGVANTMGQPTLQSAPRYW